ARRGPLARARAAAEGYAEGVAWALTHARRATGGARALFSLLERDVQVVLGQSGLPEPLTLPALYDMSYSICQHVVTGIEGVIGGVEDARGHPLASATRAVTDLGVVAYLGKAVCAPCGAPVGTICLSDVETRVWSARDADDLREAVEVVEHALARALAEREPPDGPRNIFAPA
ncbi:MAG: hypothetical protein ACU0CO_17960, partial [Shimia sp.]